MRPCTVSTSCGCDGHEQTQNYAPRRTEEGLTKAEILRCVKRFIARKLNRIILGRPEVRTREPRSASLLEDQAPAGQADRSSMGVGLVGGSRAGRIEFWNLRKTPS